MMSGPTLALFDEEPLADAREALAPGAWVLRGFASAQGDGLMHEIAKIAAISPFRHLVTPGG